MNAAAMNPTEAVIQTLPREVQMNILTYLRAFDLSAVQMTCRTFNDPELIDSVVRYFADHVYSAQFTQEIFRQEIGNAPTRYTLGHLRTIELTVVARVLSSPEPKQGFYVSKSWIKKTLLWLETVNEPPTGHNSTPKKLNKKQQRQRARRLSDVSPPWPDANSDILCSHQNLQRCGVKAARSRRRLMDKQAWKILKKLYPDSTQLESIRGECLQCLMESETARKNENDRLENEKLERQKPLAHPLVRRFYTRNRGVPTECLVGESTSESTITPSAVPSMMTTKPAVTLSCPLKSGSYVILPRAWCHQWRRYMKTGEGGRPLPPDSSALLCDAHKRPLIPPHLEAFLSGKTHQLLSTVKVPTVVPETTTASNNAAAAAAVGIRRPTLDVDMVNALMAAGISQVELVSQHVAMLQLQQLPPRPPPPAAAVAVQPPREQPPVPGLLAPPDLPPAAGPIQMNRFESNNGGGGGTLNDLLDRENHIVVELVTEEEWYALLEQYHEDDKYYNNRKKEQQQLLGKQSGSASTTATSGWSAPSSSRNRLASHLPFCVKINVTSTTTTITTTPDEDHEDDYPQSQRSSLLFCYSTRPCRECDPTGSRFSAGAEVKYRPRNRGELKGSSSSSSSSSMAESKRTPHVEY